MLIYRHWAIMVYSEKLLNIIALMKCEDYHYNMHYNCLYLNKGNNSSVKESILAKRIGYREFMVLIICTKNESNLTNRYCDMVPDGQKVRTDGRNGRTHGRRQHYIPPTSSRDNIPLGSKMAGPWGLHILLRISR